MGGRTSIGLSPIAATCLVVEQANREVDMPRTRMMVGEETNELLDWLCQRTGPLSITMGVDGCVVSRGGDSRTVTPDQCSAAIEWIARQLT